MRIVLLHILILLSTGLVGQIAADAEKGLELLHRERRVSRTIEIGTKVILALGDDKFKGVLESVDETGITVDGTTYPFRDITWIGVRTKWTTTLAVGVIAFGIGVGTAGAVYLASAAGTGFVTTLLVVGAGAGIASVGIPLLKHGKRYYLDSEWKVIPPGL